MSVLPVAAPENAGAWKLAREGDREAFATLVEQHERMVFSIALHALNDRERAEEIAQDVFLELYRHLGTITSGDHLVFWLRQVTSRRCIDEIRKRRFRMVPIEAVEDIAVSPAADHLDDLVLRRLVASLPEAQRLVIALRYQEDLDPSQIGRILAMPVNTVKSHLQRGIKALRKAFGERS